MKTTYLIYKQINGVRQLVPATQEEWNSILKKNKGLLPLQIGRCGRTDKSTQQKNTDGMVLTLCGVCLKQFICSPEHIVKRVDRTQTKEPCVYCNIRDGYDYQIIHKRKRLGDDRY